MAKKETDWKTTITDLIKSQLLSRVKEYVDEFSQKVQTAIAVTQKKIIRSLTALAFMLLGIVFAIIGAAFFLIDVLNFSRSTVFLITGAILILIAIILAQSAKLLKYDFN